MDSPLDKNELESADQLTFKGPNRPKLIHREQQQQQQQEAGASAAPSSATSTTVVSGLQAGNVAQILPTPVSKLPSRMVGVLGTCDRSRHAHRHRLAADNAGMRCDVRCSFGGNYLVYEGHNLMAADNTGAFTCASTRVIPSRSLILLLHFVGPI